MSSQVSKVQRIHRRPFVQGILDGVPEALVVAGLGSATYDLYAAGDRDTNFYLWGAMGAAVPVGLGLALSQPSRSVVVLTGDGEMLMGMGSLASVAVQAPNNLAILVLDNGHFGETGMQPSHTSFGTDLSAIASAAGIASSFRIDSMESIPDIVDMITSRAETTFFQVLVEPEELSRTFPPRDGAFVRERFRAALGFQPF